MANKKSGNERRQFNKTLRKYQKKTEQSMIEMGKAIKDSPEDLKLVEDKILYFASTMYAAHKYGNTFLDQPVMNPVVFFNDKIEDAIKTLQKKKQQGSRWLCTEPFIGCWDKVRNGIATGSLKMPEVAID